MNKFKIHLWGMATGVGLILACKRIAEGNWTPALISIAFAVMFTLFTVFEESDS